VLDGPDRRFTAREWRRFMRWECSECGYTGESAEAPHVCVCCGTAGGFFARTEPGIEGDAHADTMFDSWLHTGMERADHPVRRHPDHPRGSEALHEGHHGTHAPEGVKKA
jgi:hypothetical protein